jgi:DNA-binding CsgD family transcriptional regulator
LTDSRHLSAQARQERVKLLLIRNLSLSEIADALGVSLRTVNYDVKQIREEAAAKLSRLTVFDLAVTMQARSDARHRVLWSLFAQVDAAERSGLAMAKAVTLKLNILKELSRQTTKEQEMLVRLGIVIPAEKESNLDMKALTLLNSVPPAVLGRSLTEDPKQFVETMRMNLGDAAMTELLSFLGRARYNGRDDAANMDTATDEHAAATGSGETGLVHETPIRSRTKLDAEEAQNADATPTLPRRLSARSKPLVYKEIDVDKIPPISYNYEDENRGLNSEYDDSERPRTLERSMG